MKLYKPTWRRWKLSKVKGIIFDMDNTLLQSSIDFPAMKAEVFAFLMERRVFPADFHPNEHTTSTMIELAKKAGIPDDAYSAMMDITVRHELAGMEAAGLEPGVQELLDTLDGRYVLAVVTNNSYAAAVKALETTGIAEYFRLIVGRDQMNAMKPSPSGYLYVKERFSGIETDEWLSAGDSWIDGKASADAGIPFVGYRTNVELLAQKGVTQLARIEDIRDLRRYLE